MAKETLFDVLADYKESLSPMQVYLRDTATPYEQREAARKEAIREQITAWKDGTEHPVTVLLKVVEAVLNDRHPLSNMLHAAQNQDYFEHIYRSEEVAEENQPKRHREIAEEMITNNLAEEYQDPAYVPTESTINWLEKTLSSLDEKDSLRLAALVVNTLTPNNSADIFSRRRNRKGHQEDIIKEIELLRRDEEYDNKVHANDAHIDGDLIDVLVSHEDRADYIERDVRNEYATEDEVEVRRSVEILGLLEEWKAGAHPYLIMTDLINVGLDGVLNNPLRSIISDAKRERRSEQEYRVEDPRNPNSKHGNESPLAYVLRHVDSIRRRAREVMHQMEEDVVAYRGPESHPEFTAKIDEIIAMVEDDEQHTFGAIESIVDVMFGPPDEEPVAEVKRRLLESYGIDAQKLIGTDLGEMLDDEPEQFVDIFSAAAVDVRPKGNDPIAKQIRFYLRSERAKEQARFEKKKPMAALQIEKEDKTKEGLSEVFERDAERREDETKEPLPKLTEQIEIVASGTGLIKPYPTGADDPDNDEYYDRHEEELYGTTTARITTYSVNLVPKTPEQADALKKTVEWALKAIADTKPAFPIPFDYDARKEAYKRPDFRQDLYEREKSYKNCAVKITDDGDVQIETRLDLDDLWNLYYLLEEVIEPSEQIAAAMNMARYAEERGPLMQKDDLNGSYSNSNMRPETQIGSLENVSPENYVPVTMEQTLALYALGEIDEEQLVQRTVELAEHTLSGRMVDPHGLLPSYEKMRLIADHTAAAEGNDGMGTELATYDEALGERTREIMMIMAGLNPKEDKDRPVVAALMGTVAKLSGPLRKSLRDQLANQERVRWDSFRTRMEEMRNVTSLEDLIDPVILEQLDEMAEASDPNTEREEQRALAYQANIVLRDSDVGPTTSRTWRDTDYVSRSGGSIWVRKEMPKSLEPFMPKNQGPDMSQALKMIGYS